MAVELRGLIAVQVGMRKRAGRALAAIGWCASLVACGSSYSSERSPANSSVGRKAPSPTTMGFVLADLDPLMYHTKDRKAECPDGVVPGNRENWEAQFPTAAARRRQLQRCGSLLNRGPNCENVWFNPQLSQDPLAWREIKGSVAYGANLDGTADGHATERTCGHQKFVSPEGESGIDNQFYRFAGCDKLIGIPFPEKARREQVAAFPSMRVLLEVTGVTDERNVSAVDITLYRGRDALVVDAAGKAVPGQSQRIEGGPLSVIGRLRGRIVAGVLISDPADVDWAENGVTMFRTSQLIRGMTLRLKLTPTGAEGMRAGYLDMDQLWQNYWRTGLAAGTLGAGSGSSSYEALHRLADGYKSPETGACTAISTAEKLEFARAYVIHPSTGAEVKP